MNNREDERAVRRAQAAAAVDREDVLAILRMRFGAVPRDVQERIESCDNLDQLERLVLVAANVPTWDDFLAELTSASDEFKIVGARFDPLSSSTMPHPASSSHATHAASLGEAEPQPEMYLIQIHPRKER
jgi:hypothetical protein